MRSAKVIDTAPLRAHIGSMNPVQFSELLGLLVGLVVVSLFLTGIPAVIRLMIRRPMTRKQALITWAVAFLICVTARVVVALE